MRLREKAAARFEKKLDIRNFVAVHTNLALILNLFLTKEQKVLFKHHSAQAVSEDSKELRLISALKEIEEDSEIMT